ncbi:MAG: manganese efflux pump MntP family protein [Francisellaceae bacterium]
MTSAQFEDKMKNHKPRISQTRRIGQKIPRMFDVVVLAIALSMDAFAVSIGLGSKNRSHLISCAIMAGCYFGLFQALMPILGFYIGYGALFYLKTYTPWIAFFLLLGIGIKMIYESFQAHIPADNKSISHQLMIVLAIATSIDAMAAGFTLNLMPINPFYSCFIIGLTTFFFSSIGVLIGARGLGWWLGKRAEFAGGIILISIGIRLLPY